MLILRTLLLVLPLLLATPVFAQVDNGFYGNQSNMTIQPEFPQPGDSVEVSLEASNSELYNSEIVWTINDQVVGDANNKRDIEYVAGSIGTTDVVTASVIKESGITSNYTVNVRPTYIDIVLEPQTRVPEFYKGRALPSIGSQINATILINDGNLLDGDYIYTWRLGNKVLEGGPIKGGNQVSFDTPRGPRTTLKVSVTDGRGRVLARRSIYFDSVKPSLVFYETNALYGQSHNAIGDSLLLIGPAATVVAEPYNLDIRTYNDPDISEWEIDRNEQSNNNANPYQITIQRVGDSGSSNVSFHVRSTTELLQGAERSIKINY